MNREGRLADGLFPYIVKHSAVCYAYPASQNDRRIFTGLPRNPFRYGYVLVANREGACSLSRNWLVFLWAIIGTVVGQLVGSALAAQFPSLALLNHALNLKVGPGEASLGFAAVTMGVAIRLSIGGAIGLVVSLWLALRHAR
jgi:hypothetical protein